MKPTRPKAPAGPDLVSLLTAALLLPAQALAQPLEELVPEELEGFTLDSVHVEGPTEVAALYHPDEMEGQVIFLMQYGEDAGQTYQRLRRFRSEGGQELGARETVLEGMRFTLMAQGPELVAFTYSDGFLILGAVELADEEAAREELEATALAFLQQSELDRMAGWTPPDPVDDDQCYDMECFQDRVSRCEDAWVTVPLGRIVEAKYAVEGPVDGGCRISFRFAENPNPDLVDQPLFFALDSEVRFTQEVVQEIVDGCLAGDEEAVEQHACEGPLIGEAGGGG